MGTLVLKLDDDLLDRAETYSKKTGRSLSELITDHLAAFPGEARRRLSESGPTAPEKEVAPTPESLAQRQYRLAEEYSGEFVVLVGEEVVFHSSDRQCAFDAYDRAFVDFPSRRPVIVDPTRRLRRRPLVRGRSLKRSRSA